MFDNIRRNLITCRTYSKDEQSPYQKCSKLINEYGIHDKSLGFPKKFIKNLVIVF